MSFATFSITGSIRLCSTLVRMGYFTTQNNPGFSHRAQKLKESVDNLILEVIQPHLYEKTDLVSDNSSDHFWMARDVEALNKLRECIHVDQN